MKEEKEIKRLMTIQEAAGYIGIGTVCARRWFERIGATRRFGRRVMFDRAVIDAVLNTAREGEDISELQSLNAMNVRAI